MNYAALVAAGTVAAAALHRARRRKGLGHDLTIIITTSPVRSNPSTLMMEDTYKGFSLVEGLQHCPKIIVCDGYVMTKGKPHYKKGKIMVDDALRYVDFIQCIRGMAAEGSSGMLPHTKILELARRTGFAHGVRAALAKVTTKYVLIVQVCGCSCFLVSTTVLKSVRSVRFV
jgi:hypothetical protein